MTCEHSGLTRSTSVMNQSHVTDTQSDKDYNIHSSMVQYRILAGTMMSTTDIYTMISTTGIYSTIKSIQAISSFKQTHH